MEPRGEVTWDDVAVHFSEEEWLTLAEWQQKLYKEVMMDNYQTVLSLGLCKRIKKAEELQELEEGSGVSNEPPLDNLEPPAAVTSPSSERGSFTTSLIPPELWRCRRRIYARPLPPSSSKEEELQEVEEGSGVCNEPPVDNLDPPAAVTSPSSEQWSFTTSSLSPLLTALSSLASLSTSTASLSTSTASSSTSTASSSTSTTSSSASITSSSDQQHTALPGQATAPTEQLSSESETDFHFSVASRAAGTARLIKPEKIYIIKKMLKGRYDDGSREKKRRLLTHLRGRLENKFQHIRSVKKLQTMWSDFKSKTPGAVQQVRRELRRSERRRRYQQEQAWSSSAPPPSLTPKQDLPPPDSEALPDSPPHLQPRGPAPASAPTPGRSRHRSLSAASADMTVTDQLVVQLTEKVQELSVAVRHLEQQQRLETRLEEQQAQFEQRMAAVEAEVLQQVGTVLICTTRESSRRYCTPKASRSIITNKRIDTRVCLQSRGRNLTIRLSVVARWKW
ncbi:uncharacterized protein [Hyperolius riggenbachi]|uniref:uncharacterized protein isoform X2 n=1 Tax=Hyperolius riggenbachi TaxID=752182 RepID=UPI0035A28F9B